MPCGRPHHNVGEYAGHSGDPDVHKRRSFEESLSCQGNDHRLLAGYWLWSNMEGVLARPLDVFLLSTRHADLGVGQDFQPIIDISSAHADVPLE